MNHGDDNTFPLDIKSAVDYGLEKWQERFFWPVSSPELYNEILKDLDCGYRAIIGSEDDGLFRENLIVRYKLLLEFANFLYTGKLLQALRPYNVHVRYGGEDNYYASILNNQLPVDGHHIRYHRLKRAYSPSERLRSKGRSLLNGLQYYSSTNALFSGRFDGKKNVVVSPNHFTLEYLYKNPVRPIVFKAMPEFVLEKDSTISQAYRSKNQYVSKHISTMVKLIAHKHGVTLSVEEARYIERLTEKKCEESLADILAMKRSLDYIKTPLRVLTSTPGVHEKRVIGAAVHLRGDGSEMIGFAHGEYTGHDQSSHYIAINLGPVDHFGVFQRPSIELVRKTAARYPEYTRGGLEIFSVDTDFYKKFHDTLFGQTVPTAVRRVMLMGVAYLPSSTLITKDLPSHLVILDLELRIIRTLKHLGFEVIYKAHPGSRGRIDFLSQYAEVLYEPFDQVLDRADAYLFYRPMTTTFYEAFCTKKPVILLHNEHMRRDWGDDMDLIKKRCRFVSTVLDDRHRILVDEEQLLQALREKPEEPNNEFLEKYFFPPSA